MARTCLTAYRAKFHPQKNRIATRELNAHVPHVLQEAAAKICSVEGKPQVSKPKLSTGALFTRILFYERPFKYSSCATRRRSKAKLCCEKPLKSNLRYGCYGFLISNSASSSWNWLRKAMCSPAAGGRACRPPSFARVEGPLEAA